MQRRNCQFNFLTSSLMVGAVLLLTATIDVFAFSVEAFSFQATQLDLSVIPGANPAQVMRIAAASSRQNRASDFQTTVVKPQVSNSVVVSAVAAESISRDENFEIQIAGGSKAPATQLPAPENDAWSKLVEKQDNDVKHKLDIVIGDGDVVFAPVSLSLRESEFVSYTFNNQLNIADVNLVSRDEKIIKVDAQQQRLIAVGTGRSEVYLVAHGRAFFLPVNVQSAIPAPQLTVNSDFFSLDDAPVVATADAQLKRAPSNVRVAIESDDEGHNEATFDKSGNFYEEAHQDLKPGDEESFKLGLDEVQYRHVRIKLIDNRSDPRAGKLFPVPNIRATIVGIPFSTVSDERGVIEFYDLPANSRLLVRLEDEKGEIRAQTVEIDTETEFKLVTLIQHRALASYEAAISAPAVAHMGTLCGTAYDNFDQANSLSGLQVSLDVEAQGPYYFNQYGWLDLNQSTTGIDGRFCFFQVPTGPIAVRFQMNEVDYGTQIASSFANSHAWHDFYIAQPQPMIAKLGHFATAYDQLNSEPAIADSIKPVDMVDLLPLGGSESMSYRAPGVVEVVDGLSVHAGRGFVLSESSDFETALYSLRPGDNTVGLFPRGFIDDLAYEGNVSPDPLLGVVMVDHKAVAGQNGEAKIRMLDEFGQAINGWAYSEPHSPRTKAIFFDVAPGTYTLMVETQEGYWLAADTVQVYSETLSVVSTGSMYH